MKNVNDVLRLLLPEDRKIVEDEIQDAFEQGKKINIRSANIKSIISVTTVIIAAIVITFATTTWINLPRCYEPTMPDCPELIGEWYLPTNSHFYKKQIENDQCFTQHPTAPSYWCIKPQ